MRKAETLRDYIQDVFGKNIARLSAVTTKIFRAFPQYFQTKASIVPTLGYKRFLQLTTILLYAT